MAAGSLANKRKYNNYEFNTDFDINLYESFYRSHDPQIGRFCQIDPKPKAIESPYIAMGDNPIKNMDLLGDDVEIGNNTKGSKKYKRESQNKLVNDLRSKTGLDLIVKKGKLINKGILTNKGISMSARNELIGMLKDPNVINVDFTKNNKSQTDPNNTSQILLNTNDIDYSIDHTTQDLNNTTLGYAMTFFHEDFHTPFHDNFKHSNELSAGIDEPDIFGNVIRKELSENTGENYGQRLAYYPMSNSIDNGRQSFIPFSPEAKNTSDILHGQIDKIFSLPPGKRQPEIQKLNSIPLPNSGAVYIH